MAVHAFAAALLAREVNRVRISSVERDKGWIILSRLRCTERGEWPGHREVGGRESKSVVPDSTRQDSGSQPATPLVDSPRLRDSAGPVPNGIRGVRSRRYPVPAKTSPETPDLACPAAFRIRREHRFIQPGTENSTVWLRVGTEYGHASFEGRPCRDIIRV